MGYYVLRRLLLFIPNLVLVSLLVFGLSTMFPGSPVQNRMPRLDDTGEKGRAEAFRFDKEYTRQAQRLGLDRPVFYWSIHTRAFPDTLHRIFPEDRRKGMTDLARRIGSWAFVQEFSRSIRSAILTATRIIPDDSTGTAIRLEKELRFIDQETEPERIEARISRVDTLPCSDLDLSKEVAALTTLWRSRGNYRSTLDWWLPEVDWNGTNNRYHHWLCSVLRGDIGTSVKDGQPAISPVIKALRWTLTLNVTALLGVLLIAIPLGIYAAWWKGSTFDRWTHRFVYLFYSVPGFWLASLAILFLTSDTYGSFWYWFRSAGITDYRPDLSFFQNLGRLYPDLMLPVIILILPSLAFLFRQTRTAMVEEFDKSYVLAARARGLAGRDLLWRTIFPNASFPIITMIGGAIPGLISGSLIMEVIFAIPGMGRLMYEAMQSQDWNVLLGVVMIGTLLVMMSYLITDLIYAWINPKVSLR